MVLSSSCNLWHPTTIYMVIIPNTCWREKRERKKNKISLRHAMLMIKIGRIFVASCVHIIFRLFIKVRVKDIRWLLLVKSHTNVSHFCLIERESYVHVISKGKKATRRKWNKKKSKKQLLNILLEATRYGRWEKKVGDVSEQMMDRYRVCAPDALYNIENVLEERRKNAMGMREKYIEREC